MRKTNRLKKASLSNLTRRREAGGGFQLIAESWEKRGEPREKEERTRGR